ncbi:MAG: hypothetical protein ACRC56_11805 [Bosea sp. (in: a-proteobacteria)]
MTMLGLLSAAWIFVSLLFLGRVALKKKPANWPEWMWFGLLAIWILAANLFGAIIKQDLGQ